MKYVVPETYDNMTIGHPVNEKKPGNATYIQSRSFEVQVSALGFTVNLGKAGTSFLRALVSSVVN